MTQLPSTSPKLSVCHEALLIKFAN